MNNKFAIKLELKHWFGCRLRGVWKGLKFDLFKEGVVFSSLIKSLDQCFWAPNRVMEAENDCNEKLITMQ